MKKRTITVTRRQVLQGAGGFSLALPFLPSLVPGKAWAVEPTLARQPKFVAINSFNGGINDVNMFPSDQTLGAPQEILPGHTVRQGRLVRTLEGTDAVLSAVLRAPSTELTDRMASRLSVFRGLDMPYGVGHHITWLGTLHRSTGDQRFPAIKAPFPTIDQVMAWSASFYRTLAGVRQRSVHTGDGGGTNWGLTYNYANPASRTGDIVDTTGVQSDPAALFSKLFSGGVGAVPPPAPGRPLIVDRVIESYRRLSRSSRRMSQLDRQRLEAHMSRLDELERQIKSTSSAPIGACRDTAAPPVSTRGSIQRFQLQNSIIAAAFLCGYTRLATIQVPEHYFSSRTWDPGVWHNSITHASSDPTNQALIVETSRSLFRNAVLDLARKLDSEESPGVTALDNTVVAWAVECAERTHANMGMPVVLMGGGAGAISSGKYIDFRHTLRPAENYLGFPRQIGLTWNRFLGTLLQAMGIPRPEYESGGSLGYGTQFVFDRYAGGMASGLWQQSGDFLPLLRAA